MKKLKNVSIVFFKNKRFNVFFFPFDIKASCILDLDCANFFFSKKPFILFKLLKEARYLNKHYGHIRNRPISVNDDFK